MNQSTRTNSLASAAALAIALLMGGCFVVGIGHLFPRLGQCGQRGIEAFRCGLHVDELVVRVVAVRVVPALRA